jgi:hypothetical protein
MENKLAIAIAALMVAALAAPAVMADDVEYSATVTGAANVAVTLTNVTFGDVSAGTEKEITNSLKLNNTGNAAADVSAKFITNVSNNFGLLNASNVIDAEHFKIGTNGNEIPLYNNGTARPLGPTNQVPASQIKNYDAKLFVPVGQALGSYSGDVQLIITSV